jgi:hypothetical protein
MEAKSIIAAGPEDGAEKVPMTARITYAAGMTGLYVACVAVCALALLGCGTVDTDATLKQAFGYHCEHHGGKTADKICNARPPGYRAEEVSRYCYTTLADTNCFDRPDADRQNQQVGSSGY